METVTLQRKDVHSGSLILVNARFPLINYNCDDSSSFIPANIRYPHILMERGAATVLSHIISSIKCENKIIPVSGYRSSHEQSQIYSHSLKDNGEEFTKKYVALPSQSEHQTGLAIDLGLNQEKIDFICPDFPYDGICGEFRKKAVKYGFIERYQRGKEAVTGIAHEPWHFRYVGYPHSEIINEQELSLEEYIEAVKKFSYDGTHIKTQRNGKLIEIFYVPVLSYDKVEIDLPHCTIYQISGNNVDGFIVTLWRN